MLREWNRDIKPETTAAEGIVRRMNLEDCKRVLDNQKVRISSDKKDLVKCCLDDKTLDQYVKFETDHITLEREATLKIHYLAVDYLNILEITLMAWKLGIADRESMEDQFQFIYNPCENRDALSELRRALGSQAQYPAIESYISVIKQKRERTPEPPSNHLHIP